MFPEDEFNIGAVIRSLNGLRHRAVTVTTNDLCRIVLSSLRGIRQSSDITTSVISPAAHSLTIWVPEDVILTCALSAPKPEPWLTLPGTRLNKPLSTAPALALSTGSSASNQMISLNIPLLQQAFGTFPIESSQVAALIGAYVSANPLEASMRSVSDAFVEVIKNSPEDNDVSKLRWWRRYVEVISNLQEPLTSLLDAEVAATNGSGGSVVNSFYRHLSVITDLCVHLVQCYPIIYKVGGMVLRRSR